MFFKKNLAHWLGLLMVAMLTFGITLRVVNLDGREQSFDETFTALRASGYSLEEVRQSFSNNQIVTFADFQKYQVPSAEKTVFSTVESLALEEPQHPPLYYVLARLWTAWLGSDIGTLRLLSVLFSICCLPLAYWLAKELFQSSTTGLLASALFAISPFQLIYAQEARQYSLWFLFTLLSSALLLRTVRLKSTLGWVAYSVSILASLYTFHLALFTVLAHGVYLLVLERFRMTKQILSFGVAAVLGVAAFVPWILKFIDYSSRASADSKTAWMYAQLSLPGFVVRWVGNFSRLFLDTGYNGGPTNPWMALIPLVILVILWSLFYVCKNSQKSAWLFIITLTIIPFLCLALNDFVMGGRLSTIPRYFIPTFTGILISVAFLLGDQIQQLERLSRWQFRIWAVTLSFLLVSGIASSLLISSQRVWWNQGPADVLTYWSQLPEALLQQKADLLVEVINNDTDLGNAVILSRILNPSVDLQLVFQPDSISLPAAGYDSIFLLAYEVDLKQFSPVIEQQGYRIEPVAYLEKEEDLGLLWKLLKQP